MQVRKKTSLQTTPHLRKPCRPGKGTGIAARGCDRLVGMGGVFTPGDLLERCRVLGGRIDAATNVINAASPEQIDATFRDAWVERLRRWESVRSSCGDYASRMWASRWEPTLLDWEANQAQWEARIQKATGVVIPVGTSLARASDETLTTMIQQAARFPQVGKTAQYAILMVAGGVGLAAVVYAWRARG